MLAGKVLLAAVMYCGQSAPTTRTADNLLADAQVDGTYGYSIRPPKGWRLIRQRIPETHGVTLLRMVNQVESGKIEEMVLRQTSTTRPVPMDEMLKEINHALELEFSQVEMLSQQEQQVAGRPGGMLAATFQRQGFKWLRLQAIIERQPKEYLVLLFNGPAARRAQSEELFHLVLSSLALRQDRIGKTELREALKAGSTFLAGLEADEIRKAAIAEQVLRIELDGEPAGYVRLEQTTGTLKDRDGVWARERAWMFEPDGRVRRLQANMFISDDQREEEWKSSVTGLVPARGAKPAYLETALEEGVRAEDVLLSSQVYQMSEPLAQNPPLELPDSYVSRAVVRMLPRLLGDLSKPRRLAFVEYDHQEAGLVFRIVECKGAAAPPTGTSRGKVFQIDEQQGPAGEKTSLFVDESGRTVLIQAGRLTMMACKESEIKTLFASRVADAEQEMARLEREYDKQEQRFAPKRPPKGEPKK